MLIVLSGVETINKRLIARQITSKMNKFVINGFEFDLSKDDPFLIKSDDGRWITPGEFIHSRGPESVQFLKATFEEMQALEKDLWETSEMENHLYHAYSAIEYELGFKSTPDYNIADYPFKWDASIDAIIARYEASPLDYHVITGSISRTFIDELRTRLGDAEVLAYNIIRNPSTMFMLHQKTKSFKQHNPSLAVEDDTIKLYESMLNAMLLMYDPKTTDIKFEDMISSGDFFIDGVNVGLYLDYISKNQTLTKFEHNVRVPSLSDVLVPEDVDIFNAEWSKIDLQTIGGSQSKIINIFERLGYVPLTYKEIIAGKFA